MANTNYKSTDDTVNKQQSLKVKTQLKFSQNSNNFYDEMN